MKRLFACLLTLALLMGGCAQAQKLTRADEFGKGELHVLVLPVEFRDSRFHANELELLETVLCGTPEEAGWQSVRSYYETSSYGQLTMDFRIMPVYRCKASSRWYELNYQWSEKSYPDEKILLEALKSVEPQIDPAWCDTNDDGYYDALMVVYPMELDDWSDDPFWWSWQDICASEQTVAGLEGEYYVWTSIDEIYGYLYDESTLDPTGYVHEIGHLLGLEDYYDRQYEDDLVGGLGGFDMMDDCWGDHASFSKYQLGWIEPQEVSQAVTRCTLEPFGSSGQALILRKGSTLMDQLKRRLTGRAEDTLYGEYLLIDLFTPVGLDERFAGADGMPAMPGVRVYHVDATQDRSCDYYAPFRRNNSSGENKLIRRLEADGDCSIEDTSESKYGYYVQDSDFFHAGDVLEDGCWYDGTPFAFAMTVEEVTAEGAVLSFEWK